jgi:effector-associated domain 1 (EAD1)-containing protein
MALWITSPDFSDEIGKKLLEVLKAGIWEKKALQQLWISAGLPPADVDWDGSARLVWLAMLVEANSQTKLQVLIVEAKTLNPALETDLDAILVAQTPGSDWYVTTSRFSARLLGPGKRRALIDRSDLSTQLQQVAQGDYRVFNIVGEPGSGKSHSRYLVQHVAAAAKPPPTMITLEVKVEWPDLRPSETIDARQFVGVLARMVGMDPKFDVDENAGADRISRELAVTFVQRFGKLAREERWIFIDGLDRPFVGGDVHALVSRIALSAERDELGKTRLIVTGHRGDFNPDVEVVEEEINEITRPHVDRFFEDIATHTEKPLLPGEPATLTERVLAKASLDDLRDLGRAASEVAQERFGSP